MIAIAFHLDGALILVRQTMQEGMKLVECTNEDRSVFICEHKLRRESARFLFLLSFLHSSLLAQTLQRASESQGSDHH
jgi:hypothetical protein